MRIFFRYQLPPLQQIPNIGHPPQRGKLLAEGRFFLVRKTLIPHQLFPRFAYRTSNTNTKVLFTAVQQITCPGVNPGLHQFVFQRINLCYRKVTD
jgi:hypothetical protein